MDTLNKFGVPVDGLRAGMLMPKRKHLFNVIFYNFGPLNGQSVDLTRQISTCDKPKLQMDEITVDAYNSKAYYAGKHSWQNISCVVRDDVTNAVSTLVGHQIQKQLNHFEQTSAFAASNYKFNMRIQVLDGGNTAILESWYVEGAFLSAVDYASMDYTSADPQDISMTIRYDNATQEGGLFPTLPTLLGGSRI